MAVAGDSREGTEDLEVKISTLLTLLLAAVSGFAFRVMIEGLHYHQSDKVGVGVIVIFGASALALAVVYENEL